MLVSLIPFFLVVRLAVHDNSWTYGPEFIFDINSNMTARYDDSQESTFTTVNLLCRPKGADSLSCRLENFQTKKVDMTYGNEIDVPKNETSKRISEEPFEIKFNDRGIDYLIVDEKTHVYYLNIIKTAVELLNIGADLNGKPDGTFDAPENSTVGECNVTFDITHTPSKAANRKMGHQRYEFESLPQLNKVSGEAIVITKTRNLDNCSCYAPWYYGMYGEGTVVETELDSHLLSSTSRIFVSDTWFVATSTNSAFMGARKKKNPYAITENITLSLRDIRAAEGELPEVQRASKTSILANSDVDRIFPVE